MKIRTIVFGLPAILAVILLSCSPVNPGIDAYAWYPGQLASYLQAQQRQKSVERCVNVGYPGKFFAPQSEVVFRSKMSAEQANALSWSATGESSVRHEGGYAMLTVSTDGTRHEAEKKQMSNNSFFIIRCSDSVY